MAKATTCFCALLMIVMLLERPASGRPSVSRSDEDAAGAPDEQSPDFRHRWGSQHYQRPAQHHRPSTWPSSNPGWNTNTQYPIRRPVHGTTTQNMMVCPPTNLNNNNWNRHQGINQHYPNNNLINAGHHEDPLNVLFLAFRDQEQQDGLIADGVAVDAVVGGSQDSTVSGGNTEVVDNIQFN